MPSSLLDIHGLQKSFPGVLALDGVNFAVRPGQIHALMGENGAGKSTLIKVLTGVYPRDAGEIRLAGTPVAPRSPMDAEALGISTVYQEINLIPELSVAENVCLGRQPTFLGVIRWRAIRRRAERALGRLGLSIDVTGPLSSYSIAIQQMVAIARALDVSARLLILDEPTSSLDEKEVAELFAVLRKLRDEGLGIVFVTHFLDQMYAVSDHITVLRNGRLVGEFETASLPRLSLIAHMIGKDPAEVAAMNQPPPAPLPGQARPFVQATGLGRAGSIAPTDLTINAGEVVGLAGLLGSGRTELARLLFGIDKADTGWISVDGVPLRLGHPRRAIACGFAFTPEDRKVAGIIPHLSVRENIVLALQSRGGMWRRLGYAQQEALAQRFIQALGIKTPDSDKPMGQLSGGNQQKVILARWLAMEPRLLILDEPTRGIDVGAKAEIEKLMAGLREKGMAILFISSELEEVVRDSQRVVVLRDRRKIGELAGRQIDEHAIMNLIAGPAAGGA